MQKNRLNETIQKQMFNLWIRKYSQLYLIYKAINNFVLGAYAAAVLYKKKNNDSLVILKEIQNEILIFLLFNQNICCGYSKNGLNETFLLSTQNKFLKSWIRKYSPFYLNYRYNTVNNFV